MKRIVESKQDLTGTTTDINSQVQVSENSHLFNSVEKLAADHDVYVSNTMIKVTYKKALMDQNDLDSATDASSRKVFTTGMNHSKLNTKRKKHMKSMDLCSSDISFVTKSPKVQVEGTKAVAYHSTPNAQVLSNEKKEKKRKKKYVNGLNLSVKANSEEEKNGLVRKQKRFSSQENGASSPKKVKTSVKTEVSKRFLMDNNGLVKAKGSITQRGSEEIRKVSLNKVDNKKLEKFENCVKKSIGLGKKGVKRKLSGAELNVLAKKMKVNEKKMKEVEESGKVEERDKLGDGKKPIMLVDPDLPAGWTRYIRTKNKGSANEQYVVYVVNPQGKKFRFKWKLRKYLERTNSSLDVDRFFFGLYQRPKSSNSSAPNRTEESKNSSVPLSGGKASNGSECHRGRNGSTRNSKQDEGSCIDSGKGSEGKELLLTDPDLPFGWKRVIHSNISNGKKQVHIISPDGKIFRRRYRLNEYLMKHQYNHNLDRFYFGLYPKKDSNSSENFGRESEEKIVNSLKRNKRDDLMDVDKSAMINCEEIVNEKDHSEYKDESPMYDDPNLPTGWKRFIKIRSCGESAGRMEVVIVSPDGRRHRSRKHLEHYLSQKELKYKAEDFDFHVFGKSSPRKRVESAQESVFVPEPEPEPESDPEPNDCTYLGMKKKFTGKPVPELDIDGLKDIKISPEGRMINEVNGLMMCCGLSSARNERRQRIPRGEHEKQLRSNLSSEGGDVSQDGCEVPTWWIQRLVKCRGEFRTLEEDAASAIGEATKEFMRKMSCVALSISKEPEKGLRYEDVAELVQGTKSLSPLQMLIPKKITYKEYIKLNRPKQFLSFT